MEDKHVSIQVICHEHFFHNKEKDKMTFLIFFGMRPTHLTQPMEKKLQNFVIDKNDTAIKIK